jgi:hypothetical protein
MHEIEEIQRKFSGSRSRSRPASANSLKVSMIDNLATQISQNKSNVD